MENRVVAIATIFEHHMVAAVPIAFRPLDIRIFLMQHVGLEALHSLNESLRVLDRGNDRPTSGEVLDLVKWPLLLDQLAPDRWHPLQTSNRVSRRLSALYLAVKDGPEPVHGLAVRITPVVGNRKGTPYEFSGLIVPNELLRQRFTSLPYLFHRVFKWRKFGHESLQRIGRL
jgi:hypothetical protein